MTPQEKRNRQRFIDAADKHLAGAVGADQTMGSVLFHFLDAALRKLRPSQADEARRNALQWLRRRAAR